MMRVIQENFDLSASGEWFAFFIGWWIMLEHVLTGLFDFELNI